MMEPMWKSKNETTSNYEHLGVQKAPKAPALAFPFPSFFRLVPILGVQEPKILESWRHPRPPGKFS